MGSGTTAVSAVKSERNYVGYEISEEYIDLAHKRTAHKPSQIVINFEDCVDGDDV
jgi:site-specific DNA-methyltransferase (adenine-specific)